MIADNSARETLSPNVETSGARLARRGQWHVGQRQERGWNHVGGPSPGQFLAHLSGEGDNCGLAVGNGMEWMRIFGTKTTLTENERSQD